MNREQFKQLHQTPPDDRVIWAHSFLGPDRTLLYGYTCDRESWHVYLKDGLIHRYVYASTLDHSPIRHAAQEKAFVPDLIPDKRVYPESTDAAFAQRIKRTGLYVPYLPFADDRYERVKGMTFHGKIAD